MPYSLTRLSDGETRTFADWGITDASIRLASLGLDTCDLLIDGWRPESSTLDFEWGSDVLIRDGSRTIFYGRVQETPETRTPNSGTASYQIVGPWWYLDNIVYQQGWGEWDAGLESVVSRDRAVVLLGMNDGGSRITTSAQIDAMLAYAIAAGAPLQIGDIFSGIALWPVVERARTIGDLIRRQLRFHPDVCSWVDYGAYDEVMIDELGFPMLDEEGQVMYPEAGSRVPRIHFLKRSEMSSLSLPYQSQGVSVVDRRDLQVRKVIIQYEQANQVNSSTLTSIYRDIYPVSGADVGPDVLVFPISLQGSRVTSQQQRLKVRAIPQTGDDTTAADNWWRDKKPELFQFHADNLATLQHTLRLAEEGADPESLEPDPPTEGEDPSDYPNEVIAGGVEDWMGIDSKRIIATARIVLNPAGLTVAQIREARKIFTGLTRISGTVYPSTEVSQEVIGTDGTSRVYDRLISSVPGEPVPEGIAQAYWESMQHLERQGSYALRERPLKYDAHPAMLINIEDGKAAWEDMDALCQGVQYNLSGDSMIVSFGPNTRLGPADLVERLRALKDLMPTWYTIADRTEAKAGGDAGRSVGSYKQARSNSTSAGTEPGRAPWTPIDLGDGGFVLTPGTLPVDGEPVTVGIGSDTFSDDPPPAQDLADGTHHLWVYKDRSADPPTATAEWRSSDPTPLDNWEKIISVVKSGTDLTFTQHKRSDLANASGDGSHPFKGGHFQDELDDYHITVVYGEINGPGTFDGEPDIGGTDLSDSPTFNIGDTPANGDYEVYAEATISGATENLTAVEIVLRSPGDAAFEDTAYVPGETPSDGTYYQHLFTLTVAGNVPTGVLQVVRGSGSVKVCGPESVLFLASM